jgi:hypothetical protein
MTKPFRLSASLSTGFLGAIFPDERRTALFLTLWETFEGIQKKTKDKVPKLKPEHRRERTE